MRILVACEESQAVTKEFRKLGHQAFSCDIEPCSGGHPEWHINQDVIPLLNPSWIQRYPDEPCSLGFEFITQSGKLHFIPGRWDMIIAFPPCTHLANSGARHFEQKRKDGRQQQGIDFFMQFVNADCDKIAIENPVGIMSTKYRKPDQIIQPWWFGDNTVKSTCLWLKGLQPLVPEVTERPEIKYKSWVDKKTGRVKRQSEWYYQTRCQGAGKRGNLASKTFPGIARAMATQWG